MEQQQGLLEYFMGKGVSSVVDYADEPHEIITIS
jgi:hypothetical protein